MKKLLISLCTIAFAVNAAAISTLDQAKLNTVAKLYEPIDFEPYLTNNLAKLQGRATYIFNAHAVDQDDTIGCDDVFEYAPVRYGKPTLKIVKNNVNATFKNKKNVVLSYQFECKNGRCLISDVITEKKRSHKQYLRSCIKAHKYDSYCKWVD